MEAITGQLAIVPDLPSAEFSQEILVRELNEKVQAKKLLTLENIILGVLYAASSQVNLQGGCFEDAELQQLASCVVDAPVMVGHKKEELPVGRVFKADVITQGGEPWLRAFFYWSRSHPRAEDLRSGIDSGIYRECSLGFLYNRPECAVCREDMRRCRHRVNEIVQLGSGTMRAFYYYKEIQKVLEISLVYRGAVEGTSVSTLTRSDSDYRDRDVHVISPQAELDRLSALRPPCEFTAFRSGVGDLYLRLRDRDECRWLRVKGFSERMLMQGRPFVAEFPGLGKLRSGELGEVSVYDRGDFAVGSSDAEVRRITFRGRILAGDFVIAPLKARGSQRYVVVLKGRKRVCDGK